MRIPGGEETEEISENVPKLTTDTKTQIQETQRSQIRINTNNSIPRHIFTLQKTKGKENLEKPEEIKHLTYRGTRIGIILDFFS